MASEPIIFNIPGVVADFDAAEISANEGSNDILGHIIQGFQTVSNEILTAESVRKVRGLRASKRALQSLTMDPVEVTDIGEFNKFGLTNVISFNTIHCARYHALLTSFFFLSLTIIQPAPLAWHMPRRGQPALTSNLRS